MSRHREGRPRGDSQPWPRPPPPGVPSRQSEFQRALKPDLRGRRSGQYPRAQTGWLRGSHGPSLAALQTGGPGGLSGRAWESRPDQRACLSRAGPGGGAPAPTACSSLPPRPQAPAVPRANVRPHLHPWLRSRVCDPSRPRDGPREGSKGPARGREWPDLGRLSPQGLHVLSAVE